MVAVDRGARQARGAGQEERARATAEDDQPIVVFVIDHAEGAGTYEPEEHVPTELRPRSKRLLRFAQDCINAGVDRLVFISSGGVTTSYFEWVQNRYGYFWEEDEVNARLEKKMCEAFEDVLRKSLTYNVDLRTAAYIVAIDRVGTVTRMRGMYA